MRMINDNASAAAATTTATATATLGHVSCGNKPESRLDYLAAGGFSTTRAKKV